MDILKKAFAELDSGHEDKALAIINSGPGGSTSVSSSMPSGTNVKSSISKSQQYSKATS